MDSKYFQHTSSLPVGQLFFEACTLLPCTRSYKRVRRTMLLEPDAVYMRGAQLIDIGTLLLTASACLYTIVNPIAAPLIPLAHAHRMFYVDVFDIHHRSWGRVALEERDEKDYREGLTEEEVVRALREE